MSVCDGCGAVADDKHIRDRIERLELATRFRPIHIQALLIDATPPRRVEDYFYRATKDRGLRSVESRRYFDRLLKAAGVAIAPELEEESALSDFQRRGFFLTSAVECPLGASDELGDAMTRLFPTLLKRIQFSYRPKVVALLSEQSRELIPAFQAAGWGDRLVLDEGAPFANGTPGRQDGEFGDRLAAALAGMF